jgi:DNA-binding MarR family transcriptional regulator
MNHADDRRRSAEAFAEYEQSSRASFGPLLPGDPESAVLAWLLSQAWGTVLRRIEEAVYEPADLARGAFRILVMAYLEPDGVDPSTIAERSSTAPASVSGVLNTLQKRGLVERVTDTNDRRRVRVHLTDAGRRAVEEGTQAQARVHTSLFADLSGEQQEALGASLRTFLIANWQPTVGQD